MSFRGLKKEKICNKPLPYFDNNARLQVKFKHRSIRISDHLGITGVKLRDKTSGNYTHSTFTLLYPVKIERFCVMILTLACDITTAIKSTSNKTVECRKINNGLRLFQV